MAFVITVTNVIHNGNEPSGIMIWDVGNSVDWRRNVSWLLTNSASEHLVTGKDSSYRAVNIPSRV